VQFPEPDLAALAAAKEIEIETRAAAVVGAPEGVVHRTIIWVVARDGAVYVRSVNGPGARWYREAVAEPSIALHVGGRRLPARAIPSADPTSVAECSAGLRAKYRPSSSLDLMLADAVLSTTLRVEPA
jgi:hypothetical protein